MTRKLKILGLALIAVFAMSAVTAASASAAEDMFTAEVGSSLSLTGRQEGANNVKFKVAGQTVECQMANFFGSVTGTAVNQITNIVPSYLGCSMAGVPVTIDTNTCQYGLYNTTDANGDATTKIENCPLGFHITITITEIKCDITLKKSTEGSGSQTATEGVRYTNIGAGATRELTIDLTAKFQVTVDTWPKEAINATCAGIEPVTTGRYTGQITVTATNGGTHKGIFVS